MAKESDCFTGTLAVIKVWEAKTFPTAFAAAPQVIMFADVDKKKAGCKAITSTGCDISAEVTGYRCIIQEAGYEAENSNHPEMDAGVEQITTGKANQSFTFGATFTTAPSVICGSESVTAGGKKISCGSITTTGGNISGEVTNEWTHWIAIVKGFFNP